MKRERISKKRTILKRIEDNRDKYKYIENNDSSNKLRMKSRQEKRDELRISRPIYVDLVGKSLSPITGTYKKKEFVDYDVVICIPSYDRYKKVKKLISQFYEQQTKYSFKIIILNDGSKSKLYDSLNKIFPDITYLKNDKPNGKVLHWYCYNQMWEHLKDIKCHAVLQTDDDFILSENFLDTITDLFFDEKEKNNRVMAIAPHLWSFNATSEYEGWWKRSDFVDGIALIDIAVIEEMNYELQPVNVENVSKPGVPVGAWSQIAVEIKKMKNIIHQTPVSLVYHDGNDDSKLHGDVRNNGKGGVYTRKYIGKL